MYNIHLIIRIVIAIYMNNKEIRPVDNINIT